MDLGDTNLYWTASSRALLAALGSPCQGEPRVVLKVSLKSEERRMVKVGIIACRASALKDGAYKLIAALDLST